MSRLPGCAGDVKDVCVAWAWAGLGGAALFMYIDEACTMYTYACACIGMCPIWPAYARILSIMYSICAHMSEMRRRGLSIGPLPVGPLSSTHPYAYVRAHGRTVPPLQSVARCPCPFANVGMIMPTKMFQRMFRRMTMESNNPCGLRPAIPLVLYRTYDLCSSSLLRPPDLRVPRSFGESSGHPGHPGPVTAVKSLIEQSPARALTWCC
jgi:hypothetical protein